MLDDLLAATGGTNLWPDVHGFQKVSKEDAPARPADVVVRGLIEGTATASGLWRLTLVSTAAVLGRQMLFASTGNWHLPRPLWCR